MVQLLLAGKHIKHHSFPGPLGKKTSAIFLKDPFLLMVWVQVGMEWDGTLHLYDTQDQI